MKRILFTIFLIGSFSCFAQNTLSWSASLGGSFPLANFSSMSFDRNTLVSNCGLFDENATCGAASTGFNVGVEAFLPMQKENLQFTFSADLHFNGLNSEAKKFMNILSYYLDETLKEQAQRNGATSIASSCALKRKSAYINVPIMAGMRYTKPLESGMDFFVEGGVGVNLRFIQPMLFIEKMNYFQGGHYYEFNISEKYRYSAKGTVAFRLGAGLRFTENLSLSAYYYYLGKGDVSSTIIAKDLDDRSAQPTEGNVQLGYVNPMLAVVKLGYSF